MELYLLRHAIAVEREHFCGEDRERPLTPAGIKKMRRIARGMKAMKLSFDLILTSPYERAKDTAALVAERGAGEKIWGSMVKQALKRRKPGFNESYYGFRAFSDLLEEAATRKLVLLEHDEKSGGYLIRLA